MDFFAILLTPLNSSLKAGMCLIATNGKNIEINLWQNPIYILVNNYLIHNTKCFYYINSLLRRIEDVCIGFCLKNALAVLDRNN